MPPRERRQPTRWWRSFALALLPLTLGGCLMREPAQPTSAVGAVATVPARFFTATVAALPPSAPPTGRYMLGTITTLDPTDPANTYAVALLQPETKGLRLILRVDGLPTPAPPPVSYELVTASGVFRPLADGEWDRATMQGGAWSESGTLTFVIPRELRTGQLSVVDYYYPQIQPEIQATPGSLAPLVRRTLATFALDRLP